MSTSSKSVDIDVVFLHLPPKELQRYLLSHLDLSSLKAARCVSKLWQSFIDSNLEFHLVLSDSTKRYVEAFGASRQVASLTSNTFQGKYPSEGIPIRTKMLRLSIKDFEEDELLKLPHRHGRNSQNVGLTYFNFRRLVYDFQNIEKFHITSLAVASFDSIHRNQMGRVFMPNLKEVIVTFFDGGFHQLLPFTKNYFPKLESLNIANFAEKRKDRPMLYSWIFGFVGRHRETLTEVSLILPEGVLDGRGTLGGIIGGSLHGNVVSIPQLNLRQDLRKDLNTPPHIYNEVKYRLENLTTLSKLIWDMSMLEGHRRYNLGTTLLLAQTQLVGLHLDNMHLKDLPLWGKMGQLLEKVSPTLESLSLGGCFCGPLSATLLGAHVFSCSWIKNCHRLKHLEMVICGISVDSIETLPTSLTFLNLGHMLIQDQIEYVACHMTNLEGWVLPQRGSLVNILVPKISRYLFETILHLPKLTNLNLFTECADHQEILNFVEGEEGIFRCLNTMCLLDTAKTGNFSFHIDRSSYVREHDQVAEFIQKNRVNVVEQLDRNDLVAFFIRNIIEGRDGLDEDDDDDEDGIVIWDEDEHQFIAVRPFIL